ncbi:MAG: tRNA pseudouridine(55) synthase TruB, partial [Collinsella sp.]|nr:tRNA pseudouridine(55) synthase TruB [Collinsella sp.]
MAKRRPSKTNLLLAVDKPLGITSHDVVARVRRAVGERRVGHAGTLDPLATGVMIVGIGQATRLLGMLTLDRKSYVADIRFGFETNTDDAEGEPTRCAEVPAALTDEASAR